MAKKLEELGISQTPWRMCDDGDNTCDIMCSGVSCGDDYDVDDIIAQLVERKDARLIAAAPDLYEALRGCICALDHIYDYEGIDFGTSEAFEKAKAALAKASGEVANG